MPSIIIQDILPRVQEAVSGAPQTTFSFPFPIFAEADLSVFQRLAVDAPDDVDQLLTLTTDYTVSGVGNPNGGTVTLNVSAAVGSIITIVRTMADQRLNYYINTAITADALNTDFESDVMMIQQNTLYNTQITPHYNLNAVIEPVVDTILPVLPAYNVWMMNEDRTAIVPVSLGGYPITSLLGGTSNHLVRWDTINSIKDSSAILDNSGNLTGLESLTVGPIRIRSNGVIDKLVSQTAHGFDIDHPVLISNGDGYALATADNAAHAEVTAMITEIVDANSFYVVSLEGGLITGLTGLVAGTTYYLDASTAGAWTETEPTTPNEISKPVFNALSTTTAAFINMRGKINPEPAIPGIFWLQVAVNTIMNAYRGYFCNAVGQLEMTLPTTAAVGDTYMVSAMTAAGWIVKQGTGQQIRYGNTQTTSGTGGSLTSTAIGDTVWLVCDTANTHFTVVGAPIGVITVT